MSRNIGFGLFILAFAAVMFLVAWRKLKTDKRNAALALESQNWPTVPGEISALEIHQEETTVYNNSSNTSSETIRYQPKIEYLYTVDGQQYLGRRINFKIMDFAFENRAKKAIENYAVGATLPVAYDPADPENCVLDRDSKPRTVNLSTIGFFVLATIVALLGVAMFFISLDGPSG